MRAPAAKARIQLRNFLESGKYSPSAAPSKLEQVAITPRKETARMSPTLTIERCLAPRCAHLTCLLRSVRRVMVSLCIRASGHGSRECVNGYERQLDIKSQY